MIFPEGTCTNGSHLLPFKRGCFEAECSVTPILLEFEYSDFSTDYGIINLLVIAFLTMCWLRFDLETTVKIMPVFKPTPYMFQTHAAKGSERWQVYAWAVREAMAEKSGAPKSELPQRAKLAYA